MATCKQTAAELIQDVFSPCVAVLCSSDVETICSKNNLTFVEMVQPFCRLNTEITIRDPSNTPCSIRNLRIHMKEMNSLPPPLNVGKKVMHDAVANNATEGVLCNSVKDDIYDIKYSASTPWFEAYREVFFQVIAPTEHEFMHHYLSCIFVVSSSHSDPLSQIHKLCQEQQQCQLQNSRHNTRWFFTYIFKYYLLLHDTTSENLAKAEAVYQSMKSSFGASVCHLLQINSSSCKGDTNNLNCHDEINGSSNLPDPWSQFLSKFYTHQDAAIVNDVVEDNSELPGNNEDESDHGINNCTSTTSEQATIHHPLLNSVEDLVLVNDSLNDTPKKDGTKSSSSSSGWGRSSNQNKKHGLCLTLSDLDRIRVFVQDFCIQGLVPFVEKQIRILNDQVTNRKSIHRTIFGVTKKLFTGNKPGVQGPVASANSVVYAHDAPELQVRKLGDLAFMFQLYEISYQAFHTAKRDFSGEAWLHFAGASEMAALSVFMQRNSNLHEYPARYMETAITTYLYTCKLPELAIRATLLSTECLKAKGLYKDAACQFNRVLTDADLPSALLLEQAAHCAINCKPPYIRKYTFNLILAGHRFSKCGQRKHTLRAYKQVEQAYEQLGWNAAKNHIKSLIGRTSVQLNQVESAYLAFHQLLSAQNEQASVDQGNCLRDYIAALMEYLHEQPVHERNQLPLLPVPTVDSQATKILLGEENTIDADGSLVLKGRGFEHGDKNNDIWEKLEEMIIISLHKSLQPLHVPQIYCFTQSTNNTNKPICIANEMITVEIAVKNPLSIPFVIDNVFLLWNFTPYPDVNGNKDPVLYNNELDVSKALMLNTIVETEVLPQITLESLQERKLHLTLKPTQTGFLSIRGISYGLQGPVCHMDGTVSDTTSSIISLQGKQLIELKGPRLNKTLSERATKTYAIDNRLNLEVIPPMPKLQVKYKSFPSSLFCGEICQAVVELINVGEQTVKRIVVASPTPSVFVLGLNSQLYDSMQVYKEVPCSGHLVPLIKEWDDYDWKFEVKTATGESCCLNSGESIFLPIWFRGPDIPGQYNIDLLFYYETDPMCLKMRHRLLQHSSILNVKPSLTLQAKAMRSQHFVEKEGSDSSGHSSLLLSLVIGNNSEELSEISVIQVSCVSPSWHLSSSDELIPKGIPVILQRECLLITLKALSLQSENADSSRKTMVFSHVPLGCFEVDTSSSPCSDFISISRIGSEFLSSESRENVEFLIANSQNMLLSLTVIWKAKVGSKGSTHIVTGQHHMKIEDLASSAAANHVSFNKDMLPGDFSSALSPIADHLVQCYLNHPFHVQHNFKEKRLLTVPVDFIVQSTCRFPLQLILDNSDNSANQTMPYSLDGNHASMSQLFTWVRGSKRVITLQPARTAHIPLQASFCSPGTYNLGCLNVQISSGNEAVVSYIMSPYLIIISACDAPIH